MVWLGLCCWLVNIIMYHIMLHYIIYIARLTLALAAGQAARALDGIHGWIIEPDQQEEIRPIGTVGRI